MNNKERTIGRNMNQAIGRVGILGYPFATPCLFGGEYTNVEGENKQWCG